ncbi:MAG: hypothetical protein LC687_05735 [Actinobacteria bacterium]|nr:hypothetical protein [Actinomycetota bacterium]
MSTEAMEIEFVDELPTIQRAHRESGVWVERLEPLRDRPMAWAKVYGPTKNPHAVIANVTGGNVAGLDDADWFEFAGRTLGTEQDEDGNDVPQGYVFARLMDAERKEERDAELAEKRAKRAARQAEDTDTEVEF